MKSTRYGVADGWRHHLPGCSSATEQQQIAQEVSEWVSRAAQSTSIAVWLYQQHMHIDSVANSMYRVAG